RYLIGFCLAALRAFDPQALRNVCEKFLRPFPEPSRSRRSAAWRSLVLLRQRSPTHDQLPAGLSNRCATDLPQDQHANLAHSNAASVAPATIRLATRLRQSNTNRRLRRNEFAAGPSFLVRWPLPQQTSQIAASKFSFVVLEGHALSCPISMTLTAQ